MQNFNKKNFIDLLDYTKKSFFQKLGNVNSRKLELKYKRYYKSKVKNNFIELKIDNKKKIVFPFHGMGLDHTVGLFGYYEHLIFLIYYLKKNDYKKKVADIGSNLGLHSLILSNFGYKVDSFEPDPEHFEYQKKILKKNRCKNVNFINKAVYDFNGSKNLFRVIDNPFANYVEGEKKGYGKLEKIKIKTIDIKKIIKNYDLVKIDAEGSEAKILTKLNKSFFLKTDFIVEITGAQNAKRILAHCKTNKINIFSHKNKWKKVSNIKQMPKHHTEGLIIISSEKNYFNFLKIS